MNKTELAEALAGKTGISKNQAYDVLNHLFSDNGLIPTTLKAGGDVTIQGFGSFKVAQRAARLATNPATGGKVQVPAKNAPKFTAGKSLKALVA